MASTAIMNLLRKNTLLKFRVPVVLVCAVCFLMIMPASAASFTFCGTGQASCGGNGASLGSVSGNAASGQDLNWGVSFTNDGTHTTPGSTFVAQPCGPFSDCGAAPPTFPFNAWTAASGGFAWISPFTANTNSLPSAGGEYDYTETFSLAGIGSGAEITGTWATDNCLMGIYINGNLVQGTGTCTTGNNFSTTTAFDFTTFFNYGGSNTITFKTYSVNSTAPNPAGLLVQVTAATGNTSGVPEPATFFGVGLGLAAVGLAYRRRRS